MAKKKVKSKPKTNVSHEKDSSAVDPQIFTGALTVLQQTALLKMCRLCENKEGPFLNIFDADKVTARKIEEVLPFTIVENDDLPHKICFRCSAKLEELHEFVQKCIRSQENLHKTLGKTNGIKGKSRAIWEEKLSKCNMSNDDICNNLIKKAMESIKDLPTHIDFSSDEDDDQPLEKPVKNETSATKSNVVKDSKLRTMLESPSTPKLKIVKDKVQNSEIVNKEVKNQSDPKLVQEGSGRKLRQYSSRSESSVKSNENVFAAKSDKKDGDVIEIKQEPEEITDRKRTPSDSEKGKDTNKAKSKKEFNIMDHVYIIKVSGVGVLFQCKLCNRNFLKKEVVTTHSCAKNGVPKVNAPQTYTPPEVETPKPSTVKYINTKDNPLPVKVTLNPPSQHSINEQVPVEVRKDLFNEKPKPKPRIGPASKVRQFTTEKTDSNAFIGMKIQPVLSTSPAPEVRPTNIANYPSVQFPSIPSLNNRYKLVPGPNSSYALVEEQKGPGPSQIPVTSLSVTSTSKSQKRKAEEASLAQNSIQNEKRPTVGDQPYPVGLFQSNMTPMPTASAGPPVKFPTPAMKKQTYTIVKTDNPNKLLISTKTVETPKKPESHKQSRKSKPESLSKDPYTVIIEEAHRQNPDSFTFINVDPLLEPSYVLPTDSVIQETQITTSTTARVTEASSVYSCNMCGAKFSREKKLLSHIQSHFTRMDEEDQERERHVKKKTRKT